jgi:hypothetical protein
MLSRASMFSTNIQSTGSCSLCCTTLLFVLAWSATCQQTRSWSYNSLHRYCTNIHVLAGRCRGHAKFHPCRAQTPSSFRDPVAKMVAGRGCEDDYDSRSPSCGLYSLLPLLAFFCIHVLLPTHVSRCVVVDFAFTHPSLWSHLLRGEHRHP